MFFLQYYNNLNFIFCIIYFLYIFILTQNFFSLKIFQPVFLSSTNFLFFMTKKLSNNKFKITIETYDKSLKNKKFFIFLGFSKSAIKKLLKFKIKQEEQKK